MEVLRDFKVLKILNNSACIVLKDGQEMILLGKGIAFNLKTDVYCNHLDGIEKKYILNSTTNKLRDIFEKYDNLDTNISLDVLRYLQIKKISMPKLIAFLDHLSIMLKRVTCKQSIENPFHLETKTLYKQSYQKASDLCRFLNDKYELNIPLEEVSFLALHIENFNKDSEKINITIMNKTMIDIKDLLLRYNLCFEEDSIDYTRFITHLRFTIARISNGERNDMIFHSVDYKKYNLEYKIAKEISKIISENLKTEVDDKEIDLLMLHIHRFVLKK